MLASVSSINYSKTSFSNNFFLLYFTIRYLFNSMTNDFINHIYAYIISFFCFLRGLLTHFISLKMKFKNFSVSGLTFSIGLQLRIIFEKFFVCKKLMKNDFCLNIFLYVEKELSNLILGFKNYWFKFIKNINKNILFNLF